MLARATLLIYDEEILLQFFVFLLTVLVIFCMLTSLSIGFICSVFFYPRMAFGALFWENSFYMNFSSFLELILPFIVCVSSLFVIPKGEVDLDLPL